MQNLQPEWRKYHVFLQLPFLLLGAQDMILVHCKLQAKQKPLSFQKLQLNNVLHWGPGPILGYEESMVTSEEAESQTYWNKLLGTTRPICEFLESSEVISKSCISKISEDTEEESEFCIDPSNPFSVPSSLVERWGSAMGKLTSCLPDTSSPFCSHLFLFL